MDEKTPSQKWLENKPNEEIMEYLFRVRLDQKKADARFTDLLDALDEVHKKEFDTSLKNLTRTDRQARIMRATSTMGVFGTIRLIKENGLDTVYNIPERFSVFDENEDLYFQPDEELSDLVNTVRQSYSKKTQ